MPIVFAITVSYGRCHDSPTCACAPRWKTYGLSGASRRLLHEVVDRGLVGEVGEVHGAADCGGAQMLFSAPLERRADERVHVRAELDERIGQVRAHEPVRAGDEHRPAPVDVAESRWSASRSAGPDRSRSSGREKGIG